MAFFSISTLDVNCERIPCIVSGPDMAVAKQSAPIPPPAHGFAAQNINCIKNVKKGCSAISTAACCLFNRSACSSCPCKLTSVRGRSYRNSLPTAHLLRKAFREKGLQRLNGGRGCI
jgi:hypothetical protein